MRFDGGVAHAPSVLRRCAGALSGRHKPPPVLTAAPPPRLRPPRTWGDSRAEMRAAVRRFEFSTWVNEGPTAPWSSVSLLGPPPSIAERSRGEYGRVSVGP